MPDLAVRGATLHIDLVGSDSLAPLVILHGGPGADSGYLRPQMDTLREARRLVYYDQRGAGRSPLAPGEKPGGYQTHVADLDAVRRHLGVERVALLGYSWGGLLALLYTLRHPLRVERMILVSPAPACAQARSEITARMARSLERREVEELRRRLLADERSLDPETRRRHRFALAVAGYFVNPALALKLTPFRVIRRVEEAIWSSLGDYDLRPDLPALAHLPALVVHGREDVIPVETALETAGLLGARMVILESCGHVPYVEAPEPLFQAILAFLRDHSEGDVPG